MCFYTSEIWEKITVSNLKKKISDNQLIAMKADKGYSYYA